MSEEQSIYPAWLSMIALSVEQVPLASLWMLNEGRGSDEYRECNASLLLKPGTEERLITDQICERDPKWLIAMPIAGAGAHQIALCARHVALMFLEGEENVEAAQL